MGYNTTIGWQQESSYAEGSATTCATAGSTDTSFFESFGVVIDFALSPAVTRYNKYGIGNQTRTNDPILQENYDLTITALWQDDGSMGTIYRFLENWEDASADKSYLIRIRALHDGSSDEFLYVLGCVLQSHNIKAEVGNEVSIELVFKCKQVEGDDWVASVSDDDYDYVLDDLHLGASLGLTGDSVASMDDNEKVEFASTLGASTDSGKYICVIGLDTDDSTYKTELIGPLAADNTYVAGSVLWSGGAIDILGVVLLSTNTITSNTTAGGTITVRSETTDTTIYTLTVGETSQGVYICDPENALHGAKVTSLGQPYAVADSAETSRIVLVGLDESDAAEVTAITLNGATPVQSADAFSIVYYIALGEVTATKAVRVYESTEHSNPTMYHECTITYPAGLIAIANELQSTTISYNTNAIPIWNFSDSTFYNNTDGHHEISFNGSAFGDGTSMGSTALLSKLISAAGTGNIVFKIGSNWEFNIVAASYDNISYPLKEKELIVMDFDGTANSCTLDTQ